MTEHVGPSQGHTLEIAPESAFGTAGTYVDIRIDRANSTFPTKTRMAVLQPNTHDNPASYQDKPVEYVAAQENAITLSLETRKHADTGTPPILDLLESGGYELATQTADDTIDTGSTATSIIGVSGGGVAVGEAILVQVATEKYEPCLVVGVSTKTYTPMFALSAAPTVGNNIKSMTCATPRTGKIAGTDALSLRYTIRAEDGASHPQAFTYRGCAAQLNSMELTPNALLKWNFGIHVGDIDMADGTWTAPTYVDGTRTLVLTGDSFRCKLAQGAGATGGLSNALSGIKSASVEFGHTVKMIQTIGGTSNVNDIQGYAGYCTQAKITLNVIFDAAKWADFESTYTGGSGTNPVTAIEFSSIVHAYTDPAMLIAFPSCYLLEAPVADEKSDSGYVSATLVYGATAAGLDSATDPATAGAQHHFIAINTEIAG